MVVGRKESLKLALIVVAAGLALVPLPRQAVERTYSRGVYAMVQPRLTTLSNSTSFAWFDGLVLVTVGVTAVLWITRLRARRRPASARDVKAEAGRQHGLGATLAGLIVDTAAIGAVLYLWFLGAWGLNYQRQPLREQLDFSEERITREALRVLADRTVAGPEVALDPVQSAERVVERDQRLAFALAHGRVGGLGDRLGRRSSGRIVEGLREGPGRSQRNDARA